MPIKVTKKLFLKDMPRNISKRFGRDLKNQIGDAIIDELSKGKSPVRNHTFAPYSNKNYKGRLRPVDMFKSGALYKSIKVTQDRLGRVLISFGKEYAVFHQEGTAKMPQRKLLPTKGEQFNIRLTKLINKVLRLAVRKTTKKR